MKASSSPLRTRGLIGKIFRSPAAVGAVDVNGVRVNARDGAAIRNEASVNITAIGDSEVVLVDVA